MRKHIDQRIHNIVQILNKLIINDSKKVQELHTDLKNIMQSIQKEGASVY